MAHRPRGNVTLTGYSHLPESLSYFLSEMRTIRESKVIEPDELDFSEHEEGTVVRPSHTRTVLCNISRTDSIVPITELYYGLTFA